MTSIATITTARESSREAHSKDVVVCGCISTRVLKSDTLLGLVDFNSMTPRLTHLKPLSVLEFFVASLFAE